MTLQPGLIISSYGRYYLVEAEDGSRRICHPRGKKSLAVVGDRVQCLNAHPCQDDKGSIETILPRQNLFYRQDETRSKAFAANIDQILVLLAAEPVFSERQLARALIAAEAANIPAVIGFNKQDLSHSFAQGWQRLHAYHLEDVHDQTMLKQDELDKLPNRKSLYPVLRLALDSSNGGSDFARLKIWLKGKVTLVMGPSGVGKSSLINRLMPNAAVQTNTLSQYLARGKHTTTATTWYWLDRPSNSAVLDSPGFQEFGLNHILSVELVQWMPDIAFYAKGCRFYNCKHLHEPGCNVRAAVGTSNQAFIHASRYAIYTQIMHELTK